MLPTNALHRRMTQRLEVTMKDAVGNDITFSLRCLVSEKKDISNVFLLARLESAYSFNEGVKRIWENVLAVL